MAENRPSRPHTLREALATDAGIEAEEVRAVWDDLAGSPPAATVNAPPTSLAPVTAPPTARPVSAPPRPLLAPPSEVPVETPSAPVEPEPDLDPESDEAAPTSSPSRRARWMARRQAQREAAERRRSDRLARRRHRILPRTVIGISALLLAGALGAGLSGAVLYAYYDWRLTTNEDKVGVLADGLEARLESAGEAIDGAEASAVDAIRTEAEPLRQLAADATALGPLGRDLAPSVWFVSTRDEAGQASVGSGFVAASDDTESLLVTSLSTVAASMTEPSPEITVQQGDQVYSARLWSWDTDLDLALLKVARAGLPPLTWAEGDAAVMTLGAPLYAVSGLGASGATLSPGVVLDQSAVGIQHTAPIGSAWQGGPIVNASGEVLGVASVAYQPLGFAPGDIGWAVPVTATCEHILSCSDGVPGLGPAR